MMGTTGRRDDSRRGRSSLVDFPRERLDSEGKPLPIDPPRPIQGRADPTHPIPEEDSKHVPNLATVERGRASERGPGRPAPGRRLGDRRRAERAPSLFDQLVGLGKQADAQGHRGDAIKFYAQALKLDGTNPEALRLVRQEPVPPAPEPAPAEGDATLDKAARLEQIAKQQLTSGVTERIEQARGELNRGNPEAALNLLRLGLAAVQGDDSVPESVKRGLAARISAQIQATTRRADELDLSRAEAQRLQQAGEQTARILDQLETNQQTVNALMTRFDTLMAQGQYNVLFNGGTGNIAEAIAPFAEAFVYARQARAIEPQALAPTAGIQYSQYAGSLANEYANEQLKEYRFLLTMNDVTRAGVPFPDTITIEYPDAEHWRTISEKRIKRYESVSLDARDPKTTRILAELDKPVSIPFAAETPLEDVIKYLKSATQSPGLEQGIPIYIDPVGLTEAEKTMASPITLNLEGVPLKRSLKLLLKQLELTYTVKDGLMTITSTTSKDQPTEIRVYPVADLAIIPFSLMGGGGGGGMGGGGMGGGGMGGGGMGGGGMGGGGMGGMGGGMGGGGMGGGGMRSMPVEPLTQQDSGGRPGSKKKQVSEAMAPEGQAPRSPRQPDAPTRRAGARPAPPAPSRPSRKGPLAERPPAEGQGPRPHREPPRGRPLQIRAAGRLGRLLQGALPNVSEAQILLDVGALRFPQGLTSGSRRP